MNKKITAYILLVFMMFNFSTIQIYAKQEIECSDDNFAENRNGEEQLSDSNSSIMLVGSTHERKAYFKFDVSDIDLNTPSIILMFYASIVEADKEITFHGLSLPNDKKITSYSEFYKESRFVSSLKLNGINYNEYKLNVTDYIKKEIKAGNKIIYFALESNANTLAICSREYRKVHMRPRLILEQEDVYIPNQTNVIYSRPSKERLEKDIKANVGEHPYLFGREDDFIRIANLKNSDEFVSEVYLQIKKQADDFLKLKNVGYDLKATQILGSAVESEGRIATLALLYKIEGDKKYAEKAWSEMQNVINLSTWNTILLDNSTVTLALAVGYDLLYDYLTPEQRTICVSTIKEKGLNIIMDIYRNPEIYKSWNNPTGRSQYGQNYGTSNHNVHNNSKYSIAALAIAKEDPVYAAEIISNALKLMEAVFNKMEPDGAWYEGLDYWGMLMPAPIKFFSAMKSALNDLYGYDQIPAIAKSGYYPLYGSGSSGYLTLHDSQPGGRVTNPELYYLSRLVGDENLGKASLEKVRKNSPYFLLWYDPEFAKNVDNVKLENDKLFRAVDIVTMRDTWQGEQEFLTGFHVGKAWQAHCDADSGTFMVDALGERWVTALGRDDYNLPGYWEYQQDGRRWSYYAKRPEGSNCLVINPRYDVGQNVKAAPIINKFKSKQSGAFAWSDLAETYNEDVVSYVRGVKLFDNRTRFIVQDELIAQKPSDIWWFANTRADISILPDNKGAILSIGDKKMLVYVKCNVPYEVKEMPSAPLPTSPNPPEQRSWLHFKKLAINIKEAKEVKLSVEFIPYLNSAEHYSPTEFIAIDKWDIPDGEYNIPTLKSLSINGELIENFNPYNKYYSYTSADSALSDIVVEAIPADDKSTEVKVEKSESSGKRIIVTVKDKEDIEKFTKYVVSITGKVKTVDPSNLKPIKIKAVSASMDDGNVPQNVIDGSLKTRWSAEGEQWLQLELETISNIDVLGVAFYSGDKRSSFFDIYLSDDNKNWRKVVTAESGGKTTEMEYFGLPDDTKAKYIRYSGRGNTMSKWNSIAEMSLFSK